MVDKMTNQNTSTGKGSKEIDLVFVGPVPKELQCPFHGGPFNEPVVGPCGHTFCSSCVQTDEDGDEYQECPICTEIIRGPLHPNHLASAMVSKLEIRCVTQPALCSEVFSLGHLAAHTQTCLAYKPEPMDSPRRPYTKNALTRKRTSSKLANISWQIDFSELKLLHRIGIGSFGEVFKASFRGSYVAVKRTLAKGDNEAERIDMFHRELNFLKETRHPNVVLFIGACLKRSNLCIVTEYMADGSLRDRLNSDRKREVPYDWALTFRWALEIATGLAYLHGQNVVHRDIKSNNLLLLENTLKVADFGLARMATNVNSQAGNWAWMAPEMLRCERSYTKKVDVYSFGVVLAEIISRTEAEEIPRSNEMGLSFSEFRNMVPASTPDGLFHLVEACCSMKPESRPSFTQIVRKLSTMSLSSRTIGEYSDPVARRRRSHH